MPPPLNLTAFNSTLQLIDQNQIATVDFSNSGLGDDANLYSLIAKLRNCTSVTTLDLHGNNIGNAGAAQIATLLPQNRLQNLYLQNNNISDTGCTEIANGLAQCTSLHILQLNSNPITKVGAKSIAGALEKNPPLAELQFSFMNIGNEGIGNITQALLNNTSLDYITFQGDNFDAQGLQSIADMLKINWRLGAITLSSNPLLSGHISIIADALKMHNRLSYLRLDQIIFTSADIQALTDMLLLNTGISEMYLDSCGLDDQGARLLANVFKNNKTLQHVNLSNNQITDAGAALIIEALQNNYRVVFIDLTNNQISPTNLALINTLVTRNQQCTGQLQPALQCPILANNQLTVQQGTVTVVTENNLKVTNNAGQILANTMLTITNLFGGQFFRNGQPILAVGQGDLLARNVTFVPDNSGMAPSFNVTATIGNFSTWPQAANINFISIVNSMILKIQNNATDFITADFSQLGENVDDTICAEIATALAHNNQVQSLILNYDLITNLCAMSLASMLLTNRVLIRIALYGAPITPIGFNPIFQAMLVNNALQYLGFENCIVDTSSIQALVSVLQRNPTFNSIDIFFSNIDDNLAILLAQGLATATALQQLLISKNSFQVIGATAIANATKYNRSIRSLNVAGNLFGDAGALSFARMLPYNPVMTTLRLGFKGTPHSDDNNYDCGITDIGTQYLIASLYYNFVLTTLDLRMNNINATNIATIDALLARNQQCATRAIICPVLVNNQLTIPQGVRTPVTIDNLKVADPTGQLIQNAVFNITDTVNIQFYKSGVPTNTFTLFNIMNNIISCECSSADMLPNYSVSVSYQGRNTWPQEALVNFTLASLVSPTPSQTSQSAPLTPVTIPASSSVHILANLSNASALTTTPFTGLAPTNNPGSGASSSNNSIIGAGVGVGVGGVLLGAVTAIACFFKRKAHTTAPQLEPAVTPFHCDNPAFRAERPNDGRDASIADTIIDISQDHSVNHSNAKRLSGISSGSSWSDVVYYMGNNDTVSTAYDVAVPGTPNRTVRPNIHRLSGISSGSGWSRVDYDMGFEDNPPLYDAAVQGTPTKPHRYEDVNYNDPSFLRSPTSKRSLPNSNKPLYEYELASPTISSSTL